MSLYSLALFSHVVGAALVFVALTVEGVGLRSLRRAVTSEQVREGLGVTQLARVVGPLSALLIVLPGLYMTLTVWGWRAWIGVSLLGWLAIAVLGAFGGIRLGRSAAAVAEPGAAGAGSSGHLHDRFAADSWWPRVGLAMGVVFLMTVKPQLLGALLALALAGALGLLFGVLLGGGAKTWQPPWLGPHAEGRS